MLHWYVKPLLKLVALAALLSIQSPDSVAQVTPTSLESLHFSSDIHARLPADPSSTIILSDDSVAEYDPSTGFSAATDWLSRLDRSDIDGFHRGDADCGTARLFSLTTTTEIAGTVMTPSDVFTDDGLKILDGRGEGIPATTNIDAISRDPDSCDLVFSIDVIAELDGIIFGPTDLIRWTTDSGFSLFSSTDLPGDLDALHVLGDGRFIFSLDRSADLDGLVIQDHDLAEAITSESSADYLIILATGELDSSFERVDIDAVWAQPAPPVGEFRWTATNASVLENAGAIVLNIERINGSAGPVSIAIETVDDSAIAGIDYTGFSGTADFEDGELGRNLTLLISNNETLEGPRQFFVDLTSATAGSLAAPTRITIRIRDDENDSIFVDRFEN